MEAVWVVLLGVSALLVVAGQGITATGSVRAKNSASAVARQLAAFCLATLAFWAVGAAIFSRLGNPFFGINADLLIGWHGLPTHWFALVILAIIAASIPPSVLGERSRMRVPCAIAVLCGGILVPLILHWLWRGWLNQMGAIDLGGVGAVHLAPAVCAATAAGFIGAREGKYNRDGSSNMIPGHHVPLVLIGTILIAAGWIAYVLTAASVQSVDFSGSLIAANLLISAAAAGVTSLVYSRFRFGKVDVLLACAAVLGGLIAASSAAAIIATPAAFLIGIVAGFLVPWLMILIDLRIKLDDPLGAIAIHGGGGIIALLAAGIAGPQNASGALHTIIAQLAAIGAICVLSIFATAVVMLALKAIGKIRSNETDEFDGLDLAEHDVNAHPDFQQTTIKSYHLREM